MQVDNIILVGTSHIAKESIKEVDVAIERHKPVVIALELDRGRFEGLLHPQKHKARLRDIGQVGLTGYFFSVVGAWAERALGSSVGIDPGADMLHAIKIARKNNIPLALIDQDIRITLKRLSKGVTWRERFRFMWDVLKGIVTRNKQLPFDLRTVPTQDVIDLLIRDVRKRYPNVYRVLVGERNDVMARRLAALRARHQGTIIAIIGAGHRQEMVALIRRYLDAAA